MYELYIEIYTQVVKFVNRSRPWDDGADVYAQRLANKRKFPVLVMKDRKPFKRFLPHSHECSDC